MRQKAAAHEFMYIMKSSHYECVNTDEYKCVRFIWKNEEEEEIQMNV